MYIHYFFKKRIQIYLKIFNSSAIKSISWFTLAKAKQNAKFADSCQEMLIKIMRDVAQNQTINREEHAVRQSVRCMLLIKGHGPQRATVKPKPKPNREQKQKHQTWPKESKQNVMAMANYNCLHFTQKRKVTAAMRGFQLGQNSLWWGFVFGLGFGYYFRTPAIKTV